MSWLFEHEPEWAHSCPGRRGRPWREIWSVLGRERLVDPRSWTLLATILGSSMAFIDASVVNVALPTIGRELALGFAGRQWVFLSYSLTLSSLYLVGGAAGDRLGPRRAFLAGALGFALTSALAGAAPSGTVLIGARSLQGIAGAFLVTGSLATLRGAYGRKSGPAIGLWTAWTGISSILGLVAAGALVQYASWRLVFYINLPLAVCVLFCARRGVTDSRPSVRERRPFDAVGSLLAALGVGSLAYALVEGPAQGIVSVTWAILLALTALAAFLGRERRSREPILPLALFRKRNFSAANLETLLVSAAVGGSSFFLVFYLQTVIGYTPLQASLVMLPVSLVMLFLAGVFGRLADRHGPRLYLSLGPALVASGMLLWSLVGSRSDWWALVTGVGVYSLGLAMTVAPITATAISAAPARMVGIASGLNNMVSRLGSLLAVGLIGLVISLIYSSRAPHSTLRPLTERPTTAIARSGSVDAFRAAMFLAAALALAAGLVAALRLSDKEALSEGAADQTVHATAAE
jgi:EmrB/QacA subfamily drug resistance transporter